ncbi:MAG TPA: hypothetical protein VII78_04825 [Myxococcota bacterium]|jgi:hypothetical protein
MLRVGLELPALTLLDGLDRPVQLASLHADAPLAAIFLRHFG